ncbi:helix-turn-helix domain-containing protein [Wohlfahrtiimonas chitiniclastica]|uniref:helix-turn-helix domain-containing protein n=1 Tax=Wohlfahrtiimonas chitiniclastica TaxID=400946 RepID=UPI00164A3E24|nr:XRE family transcriptional regulator [Wohlfahrtiimonas chitiniclastica]
MYQELNRNQKKQRFLQMKASNTKVITPDMLTLAREYRGITQKDLALASGITQSQIAQMENGIASSASEETIEIVLNQLGFPREFFELDECKTGFGSSSVFYRKKTRLTAANRRVIQSKVNLHRIALKRVLDMVDIEDNTNLPFVDIEDSNNTPEDAANIIRSSWNIPDGPISNLTKYIENAGIIVIECDFETRYIDGTTLFSKDTPPIIYINKDLPADRYRFTLAHELGHLIMHEHHSEQMEEEADSFASELLLPKSLFSAHAARIGNSPTLGDIAKLKSFWKVSMAAIIERLYRLNYINADKKKNLYIMMNQKKIRQVEPLLFEKESPRLLQEMIYVLCDDIGSNIKNISQFILLPQDVLQDIYSTIKAPFTAVKSTSHLKVI